MKALFLRSLLLLGMISVLLSGVLATQTVSADHRKECRYANGETREVDVGTTCPTVTDDDGNGVGYSGEEVIDPDVDHSATGGDGDGDGGSTRPDRSQDQICVDNDTGGASEFEGATECDCVGDNLTPENCAIVNYLEIGTNILAGIAGAAIVGGIMLGGFQYMTARDNPGATQAARTRVAWALGALLVLIFFWGFLQWLVPGGLFEGSTPPVQPGGPQ